MMEQHDELKNFIETVQNAISSGGKFCHSFGNEVLYGICADKELHKWGKSGILADKIWLIGRSYAASPERRYTFKKDTPESIKEEMRDRVYHGDGTGDIFIGVAENLLKNNNFLELTNKLKNFKSYRFDCGKEDMAQLNLCVEVVSEFNGLIKDALQSFDKEYCTDSCKYMDYREHISFCSKFLHFHCPDSVFIYDHYTKEGSITLVSETKRQGRYYGDLQISQNLREVFSKEYRKVKSGFELLGNHSINTQAEENSKDAYALHCVREYAICKLWHENNGSKLPDGCKSFPRLADSVCQRIQKQK